MLRREFFRRSTQLLGASAGALLLPAWARAGGIPIFPEYYTYTGSYPQIDPQSYRLRCDGLIAREQVFTLADLYRRSTFPEVHTFHCVTGWTVADVHWQGIALASFLSELQVQSGARYVVFHSADGVYVDSLSLEQARAPGVMLATHIAGQPLLRKGGYPLRLLVPQMYGYKSVKWVNRIELRASRPEGTWEKDGYPSNAYIKKGFSWTDLL
ncbi:molybdopterin-dependent oxidoreductase [Candidatus Igneacidithiobacillus taiwanensis]|uniref:molybdopterin-dependent oxidoreductase n=1 Tax=Candidatus Igneacidithiobacillus taiwanensis TaxID=1945924 RepID=UPI00289E7DC1|nr:molybdopterin-dependent oxidoreductase [Candidatus Igneacidithiobacillus taiwanensis]MCE5359515.1 molybdopterin-dependent oxidoreductase [Acidithiobacillus sp.]